MTPLTFAVLSAFSGALTFAAGYILGAYRQREYIKRRVKLNDWEWTR